jgi:hypothetical protein
MAGKDRLTLEAQGLLKVKAKRRDHYQARNSLASDHGGAVCLHREGGMYKEAGSFPEPSPSLARLLGIEDGHFVYPSALTVVCGSPVC